MFDQRQGQTQPRAEIHAGVKSFANTKTVSEYLGYFTSD